MNKSKKGNGLAQNLARNPLMKNALQGLGGMTGASGIMGSLLVENEDKFVKAIQRKEREHSKFMKENNYDTLVYNFYYVNMRVKDETGEWKTDAVGEFIYKKSLQVALFPVRNGKEEMFMGKPLEKPMNLGQFVQMLVGAAQKMGK